MRYSELADNLKQYGFQRYIVRSKQDNFSTYYFEDNHENSIRFYPDGDLKIDIKGDTRLSYEAFNDICNVYNTLMEQREDDKHYYVRIFKGEHGYLNTDYSYKNGTFYNHVTLGSRNQTMANKTKFTAKEINELASRSIIPKFDPDNIEVFEEVPDDED